MEDADPGISDLCHTEHPGAGQSGEQAGEGSGSDSPSPGAKSFEGLFSFFNRSQVDPPYWYSTTGYLLRLICLIKLGRLNWATARTQLTKWCFTDYFSLSLC